MRHANEAALVRETKAMMSELMPVASPDDVHQYIAMSLQTQGWCIVPDYLPTVVVAALRDDLLQQWQQGDFKLAAIGRSNGLSVDQSIRGDQLKWLNSERMTAAQECYWQAMNNLRLQLNRQLYLGLVEFEAHQSLYAAGTHYRRHCDQFHGIDLREVTVILYLNDAWLEEDGGHLLLYKDMETEQVLRRILPQAGQLVVFLSAEFPHEVSPAMRQRLSITGWFKKRAIG